MTMTRSSAPTSGKRADAVLALQLECCLQKLAVIDDHLQRCLTRPPSRRPRSLLAFLWKERAIYRLAVKELEPLTGHHHGDAQ